MQMAVTYLQVLSASSVICTQLMSSFTVSIVTSGQYVVDRYAFHSIVSITPTTSLFVSKSFSSHLLPISIYLHYYYSLTFILITPSVYLNLLALSNTCIFIIPSVHLTLLALSNTLILITPSVHLNLRALLLFSNIHIHHLFCPPQSTCSRTIL